MDTRQANTASRTSGGWPPSVVLQSEFQEAELCPAAMIRAGANGVWFMHFLTKPNSSICHAGLSNHLYSR
ncbi:MAG: hypothetical protein ACXV8S_13855 [Methylobacter sp.]